MENNAIQSQQEYERKLRARKSKLMALVIMVIVLGAGFYFFQSDGLSFFESSSEEETSASAGIEADPDMSGMMVSMFPVDGKLWVTTYALNDGNSSDYEYKLYTFDPVTKRVLKAHQLAIVASDESGDMFTQLRWHVRSGDTIWTVHEKAGVFGFDANTGEVIVDEKDLMARYGKLSRGIGMRSWEMYEYQIKFALKNGELLHFFPALGKLLTPEEIEEEQDWKNSKKRPWVRGFGLSTATGSSPAEDRSNLRRKLYTLEYQPYPLRKRDVDKSGDIASSLYYIRNNINRDVKALKKISDDIYLDGRIVYNDDNYALILHREEISPESAMILTLVDAATGKRADFRGAAGTPFFEGGVKVSDHEMSGYRDGETFVFIVDGFGDEHDVAFGFSKEMREVWRFQHKGDVNS